MAIYMQPCLGDTRGYSRDHKLRAYRERSAPKETQSVQSCSHSSAQANLIIIAIRTEADQVEAEAHLLC
jgi:hypothetical protein